MKKLNWIHVLALSFLFSYVTAATGSIIIIYMMISQSRNSTPADSMLPLIFIAIPFVIIGGFCWLPVVAIYSLEIIAIREYVPKGFLQYGYIPIAAAIFTAINHLILLNVSAFPDLSFLSELLKDYLVDFIVFLVLMLLGWLIMVTWNKLQVDQPS